ncbi:MAG TPA: hypothetical protein VHG35_14165, partial [Gemmatimonadales bacterium]|nr:hypothetical protein [Gemmatimonadales bacterium]
MNAGSVAYACTFASFSAGTPTFVPTCAPKSMHHAQPFRWPARYIASARIRGSSSVHPCANAAIPAYGSSMRGACATICAGVNSF